MDRLDLAWRRLLVSLIASTLALALIGWLSGTGAWPLLIGALAYLTWTMLNVYRLARWVATRRRSAPPRSAGLWRLIFARLAERRTESHSRRERLRNLLRQFRAAAVALPDGVVILDDTHRIAWFNPAAERLLDLRRAQDLGRPLRHLLRAPEFAQWLEEPARHLGGLILDAPADPSLKLRLRLAPYGDGYLLLARDITEMQRAETTRRDFVANVSHELRTPLTVIAGYAETLGDGVAEDWQPVVHRLESQCARMQALVEDLLTLSRLESDTQPQTHERVDVPAMLHGLVEEARITDGSAHELELHAAADLMLTGNAKDLSSAFSNLLNNALRYTPPGGHITVRWQADGEDVVFSVSDDGLGIAPQHLDRLTERFYRVGADRSRARGGTGLGLAIVKHVASLHGAHLEIHSEVGKGSVFRIRFPADRARSTQVRRHLG